MPVSVAASAPPVGTTVVAESVANGISAVRPSYTVEIAFASQPLAASPVWTDVTAWVDFATSPVTVHRGRATEFDNTSPGTMSLTLDNHDGRFTAGNSASPYAPNVKPNRLIRLSETFAGTTYRRFTGYIDGWPTSWNADGVLAQVNLTATDALKPLSKLDVDSPYLSTIMADSPSGYWPMLEPAGAAAAGDVSGHGMGIIGFRDAGQGGNGGSGIYFGSPLAVLGATAQTGVRITQARSTGVAIGTIARLPQLKSAGPWSIEWWMTGLVLDSAEQTILDVHTTGSQHLLVWLDTAGVMRVQWTQADGSAATYTAALVGEGALHHVVITQDTGNFNVWLDGVGYLNPVGPFDGTLSPSTYTSLAGSYFPFAYRPAPGTYGHVAWYAGTALTQTQVANHYTAGMSGFDPERTSDRIVRLAGLARIPVQADTATTALLTQPTGKLSSLLDGAAAAEGGLLFIDGTGTLVYRSRTARYLRSADLTVDATTSGVGTDMVSTIDDVLIVNDLKATRRDGTQVRLIAQASVDEYLRQQGESGTIQLDLALDDDLVAAVQYRLARYSNPLPRVPKVSIDPLTSPELWASALATLPGSRLDLVNLPATAPAATMNLFVEGTTETVGVNEHSFSFDCSPADSTHYFTLDSSALDGADVLAW